MQLRMTLTLGTVAVVLIGAQRGGCAKYNLFYNAEVAFDEAEAMAEGADPRNLPMSGQRPKYQRCITKCQLLLEEYPNSSHIDDALFLMGKSRFRLREWSEAIVQFDRIIANFPNSDFFEETLYLKSLAHISRGEEEKGLEWFARLRESFPEGRFGVEALYRLGDAYAQAERFDDAIRYYEEFLKEHPRHESSPRVLIYLARSYYDSERYDEAQASLADFDRSHMTKAEIFEALWIRISSLTELDRLEEAAAGIEELQENAQEEQEQSRSRLISGRITMRSGNRDDGIFILESLATEQEGKPVAFQARFEIIEHLLAEVGPEDETLRSQIKQVIDAKARGNHALKIRDRDLQIKDYDRLKRAYERADSNAFAHAFELAELLLVDFERPADALDYYRAVVELAPESALGPRAGYAIGYIQREYLDDEGAAEIAFAELKERYPDSVQARTLAGELFLEAKPKTVVASEEELGTDTSDDRGGRPGLSGRRSARMMASWPLRRSGGPGALQPREGQ
jgi:TolA-binding protein